MSTRSKHLSGHKIGCNFYHSRDLLENMKCWIWFVTAVAVLWVGIVAVTPLSPDKVVAIRFLVSVNATEEK